MAIYHMSVKTVGRSAGKSATAAAAYRACEKIECEREGLTHDYTRKGGLVHSEIFAPEDSPTWATNRAALWNAAEASETRKNSTVAREFEIALPAELTKEERTKLAQDFVKELVAKHGFVADLNIHADHDGNDNHHAHILCTTRKMEYNGLTIKTRELDEKTSGTVDYWRERWGTLANTALEKAGHSQRIDHRKLELQGEERPPQIHIGHGKGKAERITKNETIKAIGREIGALRRELSEMAAQGTQQAMNVINQAKEGGRAALDKYRAARATEQAQQLAQQREQAKEAQRLQSIREERQKAAEPPKPAQKPTPDRGYSR
jgi:ATP-dependent exoDNAse (exonuclease V) alpha subunit